MIVALAVLLASGATPADAGISWPMRGRDLQRTANAGGDSLLNSGSVRWLQTVDLFETDGVVNATPVVSASGLLVTGDWSAHVYVFDTASGRRLLKIATGDGSGTPPEEADPLTPWDAQPGISGAVQVSAVIGTVSAPGGEEERAYYASNSVDTLGCLNLTKVAADRALLSDHDGTGYFCDGPWPMSLVAPGGSPTMNGDLLLSVDQPMPGGGTADVLYAPTAATACGNGELWALDAVTGERYWTFDAVSGGAGIGGVISTTPAMKRDRSLVYVTTSDCPGDPQMTELTQSLVALDAQTGEVVWHHTRRLVDPVLSGIGSGVVVVDDSTLGGCNVVVSNDRDGCVYVFEQERDVPAPGDADYDPFRDGQQRIRARSCLVPGSTHGGFDLGNPAFDTRWTSHQSSGYAGHVGADDANAFALDVCTGETEWASSTVSNGRADGAAASGMFFHLGTRRNVTACSAEVEIPNDPSQPQIVIPDPESLDCSPEELQSGERFTSVQELVVTLTGGEFDPAPHVWAVAELENAATPGGGGPAIVQGRIYVPTVAGIEVLTAVGVAQTPETASPRIRGLNTFIGPYPHPVAPSVTSPLLGDRQINPHPKNKSDQRSKRYRD